MSISELIEMQERKRKRPFLCRAGFHRFYRVRWLLTTGHAVCDKCGMGLMLSLFGEFSCTPRESIKILRELEACGQ
jgi:hypothetical protein